MRISLPATGRAPMSKGEVKRLRRTGQIPVTVSTPGESTIELTVPARALTETLQRYGPSALIELADAGNGALVMARDVQRAPVGGSILHVGFRRVAVNEPIQAEVSLRVTGEPEPVRHGTAVLDTPVTTILVKGLPDKLPTAVEVDCSELELGGVLRVSDIAVSPDYEIITDPDTTVATVHVTRTATTEEEEVEGGEEAEEATDAAEPESE